MQELSHVIILAIVQGLTEFLPVSSSAHLILFPKLFGWSDQGLAFDTATHLGTLCALVIYFRQEIKIMITREHKLFWAIVFCTIPIGLVGITLHDPIALYLRDPMVIAVSTIVFGILLGYATIIAKQKHDEHHLTRRDIIAIGCAQALALIPGVSRSGITLTAGLFTGMTRTAAARFSFLLSIPVIILAGSLESYKLFTTDVIIDYRGLGLGFIIAGVSGYLCIDIFLKLLQKYGVMPFVIYRLILGVVLLLALKVL